MRAEETAIFPDARAVAHPGLSSAEAAARLARHGANVLAAPHRRQLVLDFLVRFRNPLVLLLLAASAISGLTRCW